MQKKKKRIKKKKQPETWNLWMVRPVQVVSVSQASQ